MQHDVQKAILAAVGRHIAKLFAPVEDRLKALEGRTIEKGERGETGPQGEQGAQGPQGEAGRDGRDGLPGVPGLQGEKGVDGINGRDGSDGIDGRDGADGLGFDDLTVEHDGERGFTIKFQRGDRIKSFEFEIPTVIDRGFWKDGIQAKQGDGMTCGGSYWIAKQDTTEKPGASDHWRLAVKKGRDGSDGKDGERGPQGERGIPGLNGRDLR